MLGRRSVVPASRGRLVWSRLRRLRRQHSDPGELCDDGNLVDGDGCDSNCTPTGCGNAIVTAGETCDDGNVIDGDGCDSNCTPTACGNAIVTVGETCDDGNLSTPTAATPTARRRDAATAIATSGEACDDGAFGSATLRSGLHGGSLRRQHAQSRGGRAV